MKFFSENRGKSHLEVDDFVLALDFLRKTSLQNSLETFLRTPRWCCGYLKGCTKQKIWREMYKILRKNLGGSHLEGGRFCPRAGFSEENFNWSVARNFYTDSTIILWVSKRLLKSSSFQGNKIMIQHAPPNRNYRRKYQKNMKKLLSCIAYHCSQQKKLAILHLKKFR